MSGCLSTPCTKSGYLLLYVSTPTTASLPFLFPPKLLKYRSNLTELKLIVRHLRQRPDEVEKKNASNYESLSAFLWCRNNTQNSHWQHNQAAFISWKWSPAMMRGMGGWGGMHLFLTQINEQNTIQRSLAAFKKSVSYYDSPHFNLVKHECTFPGLYRWNYELYYMEQP